jgi:hypothetical protein
MIELFNKLKEEGLSLEEAFGKVCDAYTQETVGAINESLKLSNYKK